MTTTLRDLIDEHSATCFALQDAGNGAAFGGDLIPWDDDADRTYGDLPMIAESGTAPSGRRSIGRKEMMTDELHPGQRVLVRRPKQYRMPTVQKATVLKVGFPYLTIKLDRFVEPIWVKPGAIIRPMTDGEVAADRTAFIERMREEGRLSEIDL